MRRDIPRQHGCDSRRDPRTESGLVRFDVLRGFRAPFDAGVAGSTLEVLDGCEMTICEGRGGREVGDRVPFAIGVEVAYATGVEVAVGKGTICSGAIGMVVHVFGIGLVEGFPMHDVLPDNQSMRMRCEVDCDEEMRIFNLAKI